MRAPEQSVCQLKFIQLFLNSKSKYISQLSRALNLRKTCCISFLIQKQVCFVKKTLTQPVNFRFSSVKKLFVAVTVYHPQCAHTHYSVGDNQIFKKRGIDRISNFRGGLLGKRGLQFLHKNKIKSEIFNDKKIYKQMFFFVITKNLNWET